LPEEEKRTDKSLVTCGWNPIWREVPERIPLGGEMEVAESAIFLGISDSYEIYMIAVEPT